MSRDQTTLLDIARAARLASDFVNGMDQDAFLRDRKTQSAVVHQLLLLGEAVKRLSADFRSGHGEIPWALIAGMRDKLIHAYDEVDLDEVWKTVERDIPDLITKIDSLLPEED
ncbi:MAG: DUF86 domain-containing protein [Phycisphaerae bacterium]